MAGSVMLHQTEHGLTRHAHSSDVSSNTTASNGSTGAGGGRVSGIIAGASFGYFAFRITSSTALIPSSVSTKPFVLHSIRPTSVRPIVGDSSAAKYCHFVFLMSFLTAL